METPEETEENTIQPPDFYLEDGNVVFTRDFLLKRGYCCKNGCRHCPYGFSVDE